jgi:hypothetical protein
MKVAQDVRRPFWRRVDPVLLQDALDCVPSDLMAEVHQRALDTRVAPGILSRHPDHESRDLGQGFRPPLPSLLAAIVLLGHKLSVPAQDRLRRRDGCHGCQTLSAQRLAQRCQPPPFRIGEPHALRSELLL